jgi:hypothetical protein
MMRIFAAILAQGDGSAAPATIFCEKRITLNKINKDNIINLPDKAKQQTHQVRLRSRSVLHACVDALIAIAAG